MAEKEADSDGDLEEEESPETESPAVGDGDEELIGEEYKLDVDKLDFGDNFEADENEEGGSKKKRLILIAAAAVAGVAVLGGGGWFFFSSGGDDKTALPPGPSGVPRVVMEMPPRGGRGQYAHAAGRDGAGRGGSPDGRQAAYGRADSGAVGRSGRSVRNLGGVFETYGLTPQQSRARAGRSEFNRAG
jgi:hypothetical protein